MGRRQLFLTNLAAVANDSLHLCVCVSVCVQHAYPLHVFMVAPASQSPQTLFIAPVWLDILAKDVNMCSSAERL